MQRNYPASLVVLNPVSAPTTGDVPLNSINTHDLPDGCQVLVLSSYTVYKLEKASVAAQSLPYIVAPIAGPGAWVQNGSGARAFQDVAISHAAVPPQSSVDSSATITDSGVPITDDDIIIWNLTDSGLPASLTMGPVRITGTTTATFRFTNVTAATVAAATVTVRVAVEKGS